ECRAAVRVAVEDGHRLGAALRKLQGPFLLLEVEGPHIAGMFVLAGEGHAQLIAIQEARPVVAEQGAPVQRGSAGAQADAVAEPPEIAAGNIHGDTRRESGLSRWRVQTRGA